MNGVNVILEVTTPLKRRFTNDAFERLVLLVNALDVLLKVTCGGEYFLTGGTLQLSADHLVGAYCCRKLACPEQKRHINTKYEPHFRLYVCMYVRWE